MLQSPSHIVAISLFFNFFYYFLSSLLPLFPDLGITAPPDFIFLSPFFRHLLFSLKLSTDVSNLQCSSGASPEFHTHYKP